MVWSSSPSWPSSIDTSMNWPRPLRPRACSAVRMASAAFMPAVMSAMETPQRTPRPPGSPVTLIMPLSAWTMRSIAARSRYGPVWPKPEMEQ